MQSVIGEGYKIYIYIKLAHKLLCIYVSLFNKLKKSMRTSTNQIWLLLDSSKLGGIESHVFQLAKGLHSSGENIQVIFLNNYGNHPLRNTLLENGISTTTLDGRISSLKNLMKVERPAIVHTHGYKAGILGRLMSRLYKIPTVSTFHAGEISTGRLGLYQWLDEKSSKLSSHLFAVSPQIASKLPSNTQVFDNFVDTNSINTSKGNHIAFVGRLSKEKGADYFLELAVLFPKLSFHIYGDGPLRQDLENSATTNVIFHGQQDDMSTVWPGIGLLIMPSRNEGLPMAALEAMARGIPVLASDVGALYKLVDSNINGWLIHSGDINALSNYLSQWIDMDKAHRFQFSKEARSKIEQQFSAQVAIPKLITCYKNLVK